MALGNEIPGYFACIPAHTHREKKKKKSPLVKPPCKSQGITGSNLCSNMEDYVYMWLQAYIVGKVR